MKKLPAYITLCIILASCNPGKSWEQQAIEKKENTIMAEAKQGKTDTAGIKDLLESYESFAAAHPGDTAGINYLLKAADFYRYMHKPLNSIKIYTDIYNNYPDFPRRPFALFLQGYVYENEMHRLDSAKAKYESFLALYPNHPMAKDVRISIQNLGKSPEQMIHEFEERARQDSIAKAEAK